MSRSKSRETLKFEAMRNRIDENLRVNPAWVEKAILALYARQTEDEQRHMETGHNNARGFNKPDAKRMSFVASFLLGGKHLTREKALAVYAPKLRKYVNQLTRIALENENRR